MPTYTPPPMTSRQPKQYPPRKATNIARATKPKPAK